MNMIQKLIMLFLLIYLTGVIFDGHAVEVDTRKVIAVMDTGISYEQHHKKYMCSTLGITLMGVDLLDRNGHGTNVVGLIGDQIDTKKYCIIIVKTEGDEYLEGLNVITQVSNVVAVNLSWASSGIPSYLDRIELSYLKILEQSKVIIVAAAGNDHIELKPGCTVYPACHKPRISIMHVIGNNTSSSSNYGPLVDMWIDGTNVGTPARTGTSQSAAIYTGTLFKK